LASTCAYHTGGTGGARRERNREGPGGNAPPPAPPRNCAAQARSCRLFITSSLSPRRCLLDFAGCYRVEFEFVRSACWWKGHTFFSVVSVCGKRSNSMPTFSGFETNYRPVAGEFEVCEVDCRARRDCASATAATGFLAAKLAFPFDVRFRFNGFLFFHEGLHFCELFRGCCGPCEVFRYFLGFCFA